MSNTSSAFSILFKTCHFVVICLLISYSLFPLSLVHAQSVTSDGISIGNPNAPRQPSTGQQEFAAQNSPAGTADDAFANPPVTSGGGGGGQGGGGIGEVAGAAAGALACRLSLGQLTSKPGSDEVPVGDETNRKNTDQTKTKSCTLDGIANGIKNALVKALVQKIVEFGNKGLEGGPAYLTNPDNLFSDLSDERFESFLNDSVNFSGVCSAWKSNVRLAVATNYANRTSGRSLPSGNQFSNESIALNQNGGDGTQSEPQYCPAPGDAIANGDIGGLVDDVQSETARVEEYWSEFAQLTGSIDGNPITSYLNLQENLVENIEADIQAKKDELQRTGGFFDIVTCNDGGANYGTNPSGGSFQVGNRNCDISTPGKLVGEQISEAIGSDLRRLELADEFDEIFAQLVTALINLALDQLAGGLSGTSERGSSGRTFLEEYAADTGAEAALIQSRQQLINELDEYIEAANEYIADKRQSIDLIYNIGIVSLSDNLQCYLSKYNTVLDRNSYTPIPASTLEGLTAAEIDDNGSWIRATFFRNIQLGSTDFQQLLPPTGQEFSSLEKSNYYQALINTYFDFVAQLERDIQDAANNLATVQVYRNEVGAYNSDDTLIEGVLASSTILTELENSAQDAGETIVINSGGREVTVPADLSIQTILDIYQKALFQLSEFDLGGTAQQVEQIRISMNELVDGVDNQPGTAADLQTCRAFSSIFNPNNNSDGTNGGDGR